MEYQANFNNQQSLSAGQKQKMLAQLNHKLDQAIADEKAGRTFTADELKQRYGI